MQHMNAGESSGLNPLKQVFVVDDETLLLELVSLVLEPLGFAIRSFQKPDAALRAFTVADPSPALLITDYSMPNMTGMDLIRECRRINPRQKAILISGTVNKNVCPDADAQPDGFLAKPFPARKLVGLVEKVLSRK
jgi:DNA-binding NtrC family response regulator